LFAALCLISSAYWASRLAGYGLVPDKLATGLLLAHGCYFALGGCLWAAATRGWTVTRVGLALASFGTGLLQIVFNAHAGAGVGIAAPELVWCAALGVIAFSIWRADMLHHLLGGHAGLIRLTGLATYPLYLLHDDIGMMLRDAIPVPRLVSAALVGGTCVGGAYLVARFVEPAIQAPLRRLLGRGPVGVAQGPEVEPNKVPS
jgi:peptidoglycan/LPS O-acetylase OafA/YrhL